MRARIHWNDPPQRESYYFPLMTRSLMLTLVLSGLEISNVVSTILIIQSNYTPEKVSSTENLFKIGVSFNE